MGACAVICTAREVCPAVSAALAERQINQCCLIAMQTASYKGGDKKEEKEDTSDKR
uniref:Uncharacterized protein n=1 Tax=Strix occidentalis caurina TaxID=311401 RepID=A0A8D0FX54_STROC